ncbi:hypothetical protein LCGC14_2703410 [marine sediment metagenome]|uniref:Uncharacterized protein n=1 Tax=marine sediment metagenome TaxID=412755 RepID=A0A0F9A2Q1_9ZZZZ
MTDLQLRAFLDLLMCCDPWPVDDDTSQDQMTCLADMESAKRGYGDWYTAFHEFKREGA